MGLRRRGVWGGEVGEVEEHDMSGLGVGCMRIAYAKAVGRVAEDNHLAKKMEPEETGEAVPEGVAPVIGQGKAVVEKEAVRRGLRKTEEAAGMMAGSEKHR
ncbi:unnamed protein product [Clonostachys byssicola]|uniref:Uncharacterized protein n=1 Tax=Clonostachys byssicola TaxID=160290 RepID=A0A9N9Y7G9_9HYPO|nr:unnamed protein product [Clonostachys byssicola]